MKTTVLLMIAMGCGLVAAVGVFQFIRQSGPRAVALREIVVATTAIDINEPFSDKNIRVDTWPQDKVPPGAITSLEDLEGRYARTRLYEGEAVLPEKIMDVDGISGAMKIPLGYRVVSVKATPETSVSNLIEPGDRVDVVLVVNHAQFHSNAVAKMILNGVRVFAVNREMDRSLDETKSADSARTVSLLLQPEQVEKLMMASNLGEIRLALRSPDDPRVDATAGCSVQEVLGQADVADDLSTDGMLASLSRETVLPALSEDKPENAWTMVLMTPQGSQKFCWSDPRGLPEEETSTTPMAAPIDAQQATPQVTPPTAPQGATEEDSIQPPRSESPSAPLEVARWRAAFDSAE